MARLTRDEFNKKYSERITDNDDLLIELMEDITDSITYEESEELKNLRYDLEKAKQDFLDLKEKYKQRFLNVIEDEEPKKDFEELKEEEIIDIKEI